MSLPYWTLGDKRNDLPPIDPMQMLNDPAAMLARMSRVMPRRDLVEFVHGALHSRSGQVRGTT